MLLIAVGAVVAAVVVGAKLAGVAAAVPLLVLGIVAVARFYFGVGAPGARRPARPGGPAGPAAARRKAKPYRGPSSKRARADRERADRERGPGSAGERERDHP